MKRSTVALIVAVVALVIAIPLSIALRSSPTSGRTGPSASPVAAPTGAAATATPDATSEVTPAPATPAPTLTPDVNADVPIVPVTQFRTTRSGTGIQEVRNVLAGKDDRYEALVLVADEAEAILAALDVRLPEDNDNLILVDSAEEVTSDLAKHRKRLAFLRADDVTPAVRALAWGRDTLFGVDRVRDLAAWPLTARLPEAGDGTAFDPSATWTLFAGGDILLDRGVYDTVRNKGKGVDYPFDGGTAEVTGHCKDCSPLGWDTPYTKRTGNGGVVRDLISSADLAIANFENPAPDRWKWHTAKTIFSADPRIIAGIENAGIDWLGLANNHMGDYGDGGLLDTIDNVEDHDLAHGGAGKDSKAARTPSILEVGDTTVALLAYDAIYKPYHATAESPGTARFTVKNVTADIQKARKAGADVVIVFPHWGREYHYAPTTTQREQAHAILDAGADMIIGNHAHYAASMEVYDGKPIWYALGNFVFDQTWSEPTMSGITLELTFDGAELVQARMRPHIILDESQPNFLDPAKGSGKVVLSNVLGDLLPW